MNVPSDDSVSGVFVNLMNATFSLVGNSSDYFVGADLYVNNTNVASNSSVLVNATLFSISYAFPSNGTYVWDILVENSTGSYWSSNGNWTLIVGVYEAEPEDTYVGECYGGLVSPVDNYNSTSALNSFNYTAFLIGNSSDYFQYCRLYIDGVLKGVNQTSIVNGTYNVIDYTFISNGTYNWDIRLYNSTGSVYSSNGDWVINVEFWVEDSESGVDSGVLFAGLLIGLGFVFMLFVLVWKKRNS